MRFRIALIVIMGPGTSSVCLGNSAPEVRDLSVEPLLNGIFEISYRLIDADNDR